MARGDVALNGPHAVDLHVGAAVRQRRKLLGMSQQKVAGAVGLTFQQLQKYERGANRISASKLYEIGQVLKLPVERFFDGLEGEGDDGLAPPGEFQAYLGTDEGISLLAFARIKNARLRQKVLELVKALSVEP